MEDRSSSPLARACLTLMRPLVRLALRRGMAFGEMSELLKRAYVDAARNELTEPGRRPNVSRIAVLTGLTRKEAGRLVAEDPPSEAGDRQRINRAARVLSGWVRDPEFRDGRGGPASLPFESDDGPSIHSLVRRHGADVTPRAVVDELLRVGAIAELKDGRYRPVERAYVPHGSTDEKLTILGTDVADLIATIDHNLSASSGAKFVQRKVAYDNLPAEFLPRLRERVHAEAQSLLEQLDGEMSPHDRNVHPSDEPGGHRAMVGIYYYEEECDEDHPSE